MEEITSLIFHGSKLARDLESNMNFSNFSNQPYILSRSCDEIIRVFSVARDRLNSQVLSMYGQRHDDESQTAEIGGGVQEWLRYGFTETMGLVQLPESGRVVGMERRELGLEVLGRELGGRDMGASMVLPGGGGGGEGEVQALDVSDSGGGSSSQRLRRRKDDVDRRTVRLPAPQMGNTEIPPDDGFTWRKYGQKEILGSRFPRGYYRCTHQKLYNCPAKKLVQRLDNDPFVFEITYRGHHTCYKSSTAPSSLPSSSTTEITTSPPLQPPTSVDRWLSMDIKPTGEGTSTFIDPHVQIYRDFSLSTGAGMSSGGSSMVRGGSGGGGGGAAISTTTRYGSNVDSQLPVADLADAMFNSGTNSGNSMDLIFSSMED